MDAGDIDIQLQDVGFWRRQWRRLKYRFTKHRQHTQAEYQLASLNNELRLVMQDQEHTILRLRTELDEAKASIQVNEAEIRLQAAVIARDMLREQTRTAIYGRAKAEAEMGKEQTMRNIESL